MAVIGASAAPAATAKPVSVRSVSRKRVMRGTPLVCGWDAASLAGERGKRCRVGGCGTGGCTTRSKTESLLCPKQFHVLFVGISGNQVSVLITLAVRRGAICGTRRDPPWTYSHAAVAE